MTGNHSMEGRAKWAEYMRAYNAIPANRAKKKERDRRRREANPSYMRAWRAKNRERVLAYSREWRLAHPERRCEQERVRKVRKMTSAGTHTVQQWQEKIALHAGCCFYCGESKPLTRDHNLPLSRGGSDSISNILPACVSCNSRKHDRTAAEYLAPQMVA